MVGDLDSIKPHYRSGVDELASSFFAPCLETAKHYRRAAGYFSSHALLTWAQALPRLVNENSLAIQLIASPKLSAEDILVFRDLATESKRAEYRQLVVDKMLENIVSMVEKPGDQSVRARILAWLIANDRLSIRFAFPKHVDAAGIFHEKIGVFDFLGGHRIAFTGSANETLGGHSRNYESIDVYRSWVAGDGARVNTKVEQFDEAWNGHATGLDVKIPTAEVVARLKARAPEKPPDRQRSPVKPAEDGKDKWRHQSKAVKVFLEKRSGVLEMATGTGKTRTALKILRRLIDDQCISTCIVAVDGTDLLDQWVSELQGWVLQSKYPWLIYRHFERHKELGRFALSPKQSILVISRGQLDKVVGRIPRTIKDKSLIIHDEVHGLGVPSIIRKLGGEHRLFRWRLGLSATPDRAYDERGNEFIEQEVGPTIFRFPLELAIERGVLCAFDYVPLEYELTEGDRIRLKSVFVKKAVREREGNPMSKEEVWIELSKVYKTAEMKPSVLDRYLSSHPNILKSSIIFVETKEYGNAILENLHNYTSLYRTYYAEDDRDHLKQFSDGQIDCLITCHRISQGIDIQFLKTVVLFSSARSKLETIQRIGRCLRVDSSDPYKRALVVDFVRRSKDDDEFPNADDKRRLWLSELSKARRIQNA